MLKTNQTTVPKQPEWAQTDPVQALRVFISGNEVEEATLTGHYTYHDPSMYNYNDVMNSIKQMAESESGTTYRWLSATTKNGIYTPIANATQKIYKLTHNDIGKYIRFEVIPHKGEDCQSETSMMIGPVLSSAQHEQIHNIFQKNREIAYLTNVSNMQKEISCRMSKALYFTINSRMLHGSDILYLNNTKINFSEATRPVVENNVVYVPEGFFRDYLKVNTPNVQSIIINNRCYYDLKEGVTALGKQFWSGDVNQSEIPNFQMEHLGQGLIVISDTPNIFDAIKDRDLINETCNMLYNMHATKKQMEWFENARYGMFVHFDVSSTMNLEISWDRKALRLNDAELSFYPDEGPFNNRCEPMYDSAYKHFNPKPNSPQAWVTFAKNAGMKYIVLTTKHHGGFSNFKTAYDNYSIEYTLYDGDIVGEFVSAAHEAGLKVGLYYSIRDWYHGTLSAENQHRFLEYTFGSLQELLSNYGKIDLIWFDSINGGHESFQTYNDFDLRTLFRRMKQLNPDVIINDRMGLREAKDSCGLSGDYTTPEQKAGSFQLTPWESCVTMLTDDRPGHSGYGWSYNPTYHMKSFEQSAAYVITNVINNGNVLYNVAPTMTGEIPQEQKDAINEVYERIYKPYGEAIYGTQGMEQYSQQSWGGATSKMNEKGTQDIYLHIAPVIPGKIKPREQSLTIPKPDNTYEYNFAILLKEDNTSKVVQLEKCGNNLVLTLPEDETWSDIDTVIKITC